MHLQPDTSSPVTNSRNVSKNYFTSHPESCPHFPKAAHFCAQREFSQLSEQVALNMMTLEHTLGAYRAKGPWGIPTNFGTARG